MHIRELNRFNSATKLLQKGRKVGNGLYLKKSLGQHLLKYKPKHLLDHFNQYFKDILNHIVNKPSTQQILHIVEIGAGTGAVTRIYLENMAVYLTTYFLENARDYNEFNSFISRVHIIGYLVELDNNMIGVLESHLRQIMENLSKTLLDMISERFGNNANIACRESGLVDMMIKIKVINKDAVKLKLSDLLELNNNFQQKVDQIKPRVNKIKEEHSIYFIGALPYNVSKNIIIHLNSEYNKLANTQSYKDSNIWHYGGFTYILQKEVAQSFAATCPKTTFLANILRLDAIPDSIRIVQKLEPTFFAPPPKVESAILVGDLKPINELLPIEKRQFIIGMLRLLSRYPRKQLGTVAKLLAARGLLTKNIASRIQRNVGHKRFAEVSLLDWLAILME